MPYTIQEAGGRYFVSSPKGKTWKTTYASQAAAQKAISYIEGRYSAPPGIVEAAPASILDGDDLDDAPDTTHDRKVLNIPPRPGPEDDTEGW